MSALAADFKVGIVSEHHVRNVLTAIVNTMNIDNREEVLKRALAKWFIEDGVDNT